MKNRRAVKWVILAGVLMIAAALAACGGFGNTSAQPTTAPTTAARRTAAPTRAGSNAPAPTQDQLDDSSAAVGEGTPGAGPTQDQLDDSSSNGGESGTPAGGSGGPQTQDGKVVLANTVWLVDNGQTYRFCQSGRWDVLQGSDTVIKTGTFEAQDDSVSVKNNADQKTIQYKMGWKPADNKLELTDGGTTLTLQYKGKANCK